jgi:hypothetical protein
MPDRFAGASEMPDTMAGVPAGVFSSFAFDDSIDDTSSLQFTVDRSRVVRVLMVVVMMFSFLFRGFVDQFVSDSSSSIVFADSIRASIHSSRDIQPNSRQFAE